MMPLQNRVNPFGDIVAIPQRGTFTGNRGIIHDPQTRTLTKRRWTNKAWLICSCEYKSRQRKVMGQRTWTELFFLDEAVALAAGHRPCPLVRQKLHLSSCADLRDRFLKSFAQWHTLCRVWWYPRARLPSRTRSCCRHQT